MASSQNLSFMIKATKVMLFLMKIISSFEVLWPNFFKRLINEYIRDVWEKKKHVSSTVCYDHHFCSSNFHLVSQFSFDWSRTALIVVSGMIPIRDFRKAQVLAFIECFFVHIKKINYSMPKNFLTLVNAAVTVISEKSYFSWVRDLDVT